MTEDLLIFLWKNKLYFPETLILSDGTTIEVVHPGERNNDSGPDFFNTRIKTGNTIWAGNAEVHVRASDWIRHKHNEDAAFQNVILHIVAENDAVITNSGGEEIPTVTIKCDDAILARYHYLLQNTQWVPCAKHIKQIDPFIVTFWLEKLGIARLESKINDISAHLGQTQNNWEEVLYRMLMRSFGFHLNCLPFEDLAKALPYKVLEKHAESLLHLEALLFGQAGFLNELLPYDDSFTKLQKEYRYLANKYNLKAIPRHYWKFLRLRPGNFPTIRLAQVAALIPNRSKLFTFIKDVQTIPELKSIFEVTTSAYWNNHYQFGKVSKEKNKTIGDDSIESIIINSIVPILFIYGKKTGQEQYQNKALDFLGQLNPEKNAITDNWIKLGIKPTSAFHTQALLQLKNFYCDKHRCLECEIGSKILTNTEKC
ncbi:MAG TPA: DUF2851 family protein [Bacteroidales bacterium]|nr:DUF2851 family protein [Bacteroidales bacterium]